MPKKEVGKIEEFISKIGSCIMAKNLWSSTEECKTVP